MRKIITLVIAAAMLICTFSACAKEEGVPSGFKTASNEVCDFDFYVPETWTVSQSSGTVAAYCSPADPSSISVMPGELEHADDTVDDWWKNYKSDFESVYKNFTLISEKEAILGGVKGKSYTFTANLTDAAETGDVKEKPVTYYFNITAVVLRSRLYMMTFTSTEDLYEDHTTVLESVKENFKFH